MSSGDARHACVGEGRGGLLQRPLELDPELRAQLLRVPEDAQDAGGIRLERAGLREVKPAVVDDQAIGEGGPPPPAPDRAVARQAFLAPGDQPGRDAVDRAGVAVVVPHEALDPEPDLVVLVAEALGHGRLEPPLEHVLLRPGQEVQLVPDAPEEGQGRVRGRPLLGGQEALVLELPERARPEPGRGEPERRVDVAQRPGRLLDVGLLQVHGAAVAPVPLVPLRQHLGQELRVVPAVHLAPEGLLELAEEAGVAGEHAGGLHRGAAREVRPRDGETVVEGAAGVADPEPEVPERVEDLLGHPLDVGGDLALVDQHQVEVGRGVELAPPVSSERDQHQGRRGVARGAHLAVGGLVEPPQEIVHEGRVRADALGPRRAVRVADLEAVVPGRDVLAEEVEARAPPSLGPLRLGADEALPERRLRATQAARQRLSHCEIDASMGGRGCQTRVTIGASTIDTFPSGPV